MEQWYSNNHRTIGEPTEVNPAASATNAVVHTDGTITALIQTDHINGSAPAATTDQNTA
jgi:hypothetical protein